MAAVTGNAKKTFTLWPKQYDKLRFAQEECEIETFEANMSFPLITFTTCSV